MNILELLKDDHRTTAERGVGGIFSFVERSVTLSRREADLPTFSGSL
ncbi:MAG: hypothetical protein ACREQ9_14455 [Candidatus Binatia bacterium]